MMSVRKPAAHQRGAVRRGAGAADFLAVQYAQRGAAHIHILAQYADEIAVKFKNHSPAGATLDCGAKMPVRRGALPPAALRLRRGVIYDACVKQQFFVNRLGICVGQAEKVPPVGENAVAYVLGVIPVAEVVRVNFVTENFVGAYHAAPDELPYVLVNVYFRYAVAQSDLVVRRGRRAVIPIRGVEENYYRDFRQRKQPFHNTFHIKYGVGVRF